MDAQSTTAPRSWPTRLLCPICPRNLGIETTVGWATIESDGALSIGTLARRRRHASGRTRAMVGYQGARSRLEFCRNGHHLTHDPEVIRQAVTRAIQKGSNAVYLRSSGLDN